MSTLYIVDYSNWVYKFKYMFDLGILNDRGARINTSVLHGFNQAIRSNRFSDIIIALDGYPSRSLSIYPQYKMNREHGKSDTLFVSKKEVFQFLTKIGDFYGKRVRVVASYGQEADQVIASLVHMALGTKDSKDALFSSLAALDDIHTDPYIGSCIEEVEPLTLGTYDSVVVGTTDSDMYQLKSLGDVFFDSSWTGSKINYTDTTPKAVHGMPPSLIAIYKAFLGDTSDNIPAVIPSRRATAVRDIIRRYLNTEESFLNFCMALRLGLQVPDELLSLRSWVLEVGGPEALRRNYSVVKLRFEGFPKQLVYPSYSVEETIKKYKLKVP